MWNADAVLLTDGEGGVLNTHYTIEADVHGSSVTLGSAGGRTADGEDATPTTAGHVVCYSNARENGRRFW